MAADTAKVFFLRNRNIFCFYKLHYKLETLVDYSIIFILSVVTVLLHIRTETRMQSSGYQ